MEKIKKIAYGAIASTMAFPAVVFAQVGKGLEESNETAELRTDDVGSLLADIITWMLYLIGFISVLAIVVAGIMYITSGGDEGQVDKAKKTLIYAIVGLVVALMGYLLVNTVVDFFG